MTMPNGADGLSADVGAAFPLTAGASDPDQSLANRGGLDQPTVTEKLKDQIRGSSGWNAAHIAAYLGLKFSPLPLIPNIILSVMDTLLDISTGGIVDLDGVWAAVTGSVLFTDIIPALDASIIATGTFAISMIEGLADALAGLAGDIAGVITEIVDAIVGTTGGVITDLSDWASNLGTNIAVLFGDVFAADWDLVTALTTFVGHLVTEAIEIDGSIIGGYVQLVTDLLSLFAGIGSGTFDPAAALAGFVGLFVTYAITIDAAVIEGYVDLVTHLLELFANIGTGSWNLVTALTGFVALLVSNAIEIDMSIIEGLSTLVTNLGTLFGSIAAGGWSAATALTGFVAALTTYAVSIPQSVVSGLVSALSGLSTDIGNVISTIITALGGAGSGLSGLAAALGAIPQSVVVGLSTLITNLTSLFGSIAAGGWNITTALTGFIALLTTYTVSIPQSVITGLSTLVTNLGTVLTNIASGGFNITTALTDFVAKLTTYSVTIPQSVISGLLAAIDVIYAFMSATAASIWDGITDVLLSLVRGLVSAFSGIPILNLVFNGLGDAAASLITYSTSLFTQANTTASQIPTYATYNGTPDLAEGQVCFNYDVGLTVIRDADGTDHAINFSPSYNAAYWGPMPLTQGTGVNLGANGTIDLPGSTVGGDAHVITAIGTAGDTIRGEYWTLDTGSYYKITAFCEWGLLPDSQTMGFLMLSDGTKYMSAGIGYVGGVMNLFVHKWTSSTVFSSVAFTRTIANATNGAPNFVQVEDDGTNRVWRFSYNGWDWYAPFTETRTTYMTATRWGLGAYCTATGGAINRVRSVKIQNGAVTPGYGTGGPPVITYTGYPPVVTNQTVSRVATGYSTSESAITSSAVAYGDLIIVFAYNGNSTTIPSLPSGFTSLLSGSSATDAYRIGYKVAAARGVQDAGTWTNASLLLHAVYRGATIGASANANGSGTAATVPALTLQDSSGKSWRACFVAHDYDASQYPLTAPVAGMSRQTTMGDSTDLCAGAIFDSNGTVTTAVAGSTTAPGYANQAYQSVSIELKAV